MKGSVGKKLRCVQRQRNDKTAGLDNIPYKFYNNKGKFTVDRMADLFKQVWEEEC